MNEDRSEIIRLFLRTIGSIAIYFFSTSVIIAILNIPAWRIAVFSGVIVILTDIGLMRVKNDSKKV